MGTEEEFITVLPALLEQHIVNAQQISIAGRKGEASMGRRNEMNQYRMVRKSEKKS